MTHQAFPSLETEGLLLRELRHADAEALLAIHQDTEAMRHWGDPMADLTQVHDFIADCRASWHLPVPMYRWALERKSDGIVLGTCGLFRRHPRWNRCNVGYEIARHAWGQGWTQQALQAVLAWGVRDWGLHRIEAHIHPDNSNSARLIGKLGFVHEARLRELALFQGRYHDMDLYTALASDLKFLH